MHVSSATGEFTPVQVTPSKKFSIELSQRISVAIIGTSISALSCYGYSHIAGVVVIASMTANLLFALAGLIGVVVGAVLWGCSIWMERKNSTELVDTKTRERTPNLRSSKKQADQRSELIDIDARLNHKINPEHVQRFNRTIQGTDIPDIRNQKLDLIRSQAGFIPDRDRTKLESLLDNAKGVSLEDYINDPLQQLLDFFSQIKDPEDPLDIAVHPVATQMVEIIGKLKVDEMSKLKEKELLTYLRHEPGTRLDP